MKPTSVHHIIVDQTSQQFELRFCCYAESCQTSNQVSVDSAGIMLPLTFTLHSLHVLSQPVKLMRAPVGLILQTLSSPIKCLVPII